MTFQFDYHGTDSDGKAHLTAGPDSAYKTYSKFVCRCFKNPNDTCGYTNPVSRP